MYGLARCVSLMFVVIIAFLSFCSGYRIDNVLAMTDLRRHRPQNKTAEPPPPPLDAHRIRHSRHRHLHLQPTTEERLAQIPPSLASPPPTTSLNVPPIPIISRSQRSSSFRRNQRRGRGDRRGGKQRGTKCQKQDTFRKAAAANTVVKARVRTQSASRKDNSPYNVTFDVLEVYKSLEPPNHKTIRLVFAYSRNPSNCESDLGGGLVRAKLQQSQEYYLFLNSDGSYNYTVYGLPVLVRTRRRGGTENKIKKVCKKGFAQLLKEPVLSRTDEKRKLKLTCTAKGFPTPLIYWYKNGELLSQRQSHKIVYSRRKSTLVFNGTDKIDHGKYWCATVGLNNTIMESNQTFLHENNKIAPGIPCNETLSAMCINGTCYMSEIKEPFCVCNNNFQGHRCDQKTIGELVDDR